MSDPSDQWVLVVSDKFGPLRAHGPFEDESEAWEAGEQYFESPPGVTLAVLRLRFV